ncbi:MAG TPA: ATP-dependent helicase, partial [Thermoguttaceae bacterium]|nr:ATP-dependent helicase [Thermoguttaceae bacterium]
AVARHVPVWEILAEAEKDGLGSASAAEGIARFRHLIEKYRRASRGGSLSELVTGLVGEIGYQAELARIYSNPVEASARWTSVEEVVNSAANYARREQGASLAGFVHELALGDRDAEPDKETKMAHNAVVLMTLHSAKGLEFPAVYMVGMEEGLLPHRRSIEDSDSSVDEERRLCYVGLTRAQRRLTLTMANTRRKWGKSRPTQPSRFLYEIRGLTEHSNYKKIIHAGTRVVPAPSGRPADKTARPASRTRPKA